MNRRTLIGIVVSAIAMITLGVGFIQWGYYQNEKNQSRQELWENYEVRKVNIEGTEYKLVVADNPSRWQKGLMFVRKPVDGFDGMIFIFPSHQYQRFWNMNTFENLTIYWMKDDEVVGTSELPSIEESKDIVRVSSPEPVNVVVEIIN